MADALSVLTELVRLKRLKERWTREREVDWVWISESAREDYVTHQPLAWQAAFAIVDAPARAPEQGEDAADARRYRWLRAQLPGIVDKWNLTRLAAGIAAGDAELDAALQREAGND